MSGKICIDVHTLGGINQVYDVDIGIKVNDLIKHVITTHKTFQDKKKFNINLIDMKACRVICNGKSLEHFKTLEEYVEFQYKSPTPHKIHFIHKGGEIANDRPTLAINDSAIFVKEIGGKATPITIKSSSSSSNMSRLNQDGLVSKSFPGTSSFLENQINRLDKRPKVETENDSLKQVSESLSEIKNYIKECSEKEPSDRYEKIMQMLLAVDGKVNRLLDSSFTPRSCDSFSLS